MLLCVLTCGCREDRFDVLSSRLTLRYLPGCTPERVDSLKLEALGDFAADESTPLALSFAGAEPATVSPLPFDAQWFRLSVETASFRGAALVAAGGQGERLDALVLPLERVCGVTDELLPALGESALVLAAGRDLVLAGGVSPGESRAHSDVFVLSVATPGLGRKRALSRERARAAAVAVGDHVWVLGGASSTRDGSEAIDTFDRYSYAQQAFVGLGFMSAARVGAAALRLSDGSVLVAGGRSAVAGEALDSLESIASADSEPQTWSLPWPAGEPSLRELDDGHVLVAAALDEGVGLALLEPDTRAVIELDPPPLSDRAALAPELSVALPGARAALFERDPQQRATTGVLLVLLPSLEYLRLSDWLASFADIQGAQSLALPDGRILLTGMRLGAPVARILDPGTRAVAVRELDMEVQRMFLRDDGSVLLVGERGARVFREDARSPFDNPGGTLLADDSGALCLDAYGRFERSGLSLKSSVPDARFDIAGLRYRDVRIELEVEGPAQLLLRGAGGSSHAIEVGTSHVGPTFCQLSVEAGAPLTIERREQRVSLRVGRSARDCVLDGLTGAIALGLRALEADVSVRDLRVLRN